MDYQNDEILEKIPFNLRKNVRELWIDKIGLAGANVRVSLNGRNYDPRYEILKGNSFVLDVPYAGQHLNWEIIFNEEDSNFAPDFDFLNDQFLIDPDIDVIEKEIPALANWNIDDPKSLINVIKEFLSLYKRHQLEKLEEVKDKFYYEEYNVLTKEMGITPDCIEVYIEQNDNVHFLINLIMDFSKLPPYIQPSAQKEKVLNPGEDVITLKVSYSANRAIVQLQISPRVESAIGNTKQLHIPPFNRNASLADYILAIRKLIDEKLQQIVEGYRLRNEYISSLLAYQGKSVIEYDSIDFCEITMLLEVDGIYALATVSLGKRFPLDKPLLQLSSVCKEDNGVPASAKFNSYGYNPKWHPQILARNLLQYIAQIIPKFHGGLHPEPEEKLEEKASTS